MRPRISASDSARTARAAAQMSSAIFTACDGQEALNVFVAAVEGFDLSEWSCAY
jgi:hypothetical protein